jgi:hypothetical protein
MFVQIQDLTRDNWTHVRTFVNQIDEVYPPPASAFISLDYQDNIPKKVEFCFGAITTNHNEDEVSYDVWHLQGGRINRVAQIIIPDTDFTFPLNRIVEVNSGKIWVTHNDNDPNNTDTVSGSVFCRIVEQ